MNKIDTILRKQINDNKTPSVQYIIFDENEVIHKFIHGFADLKNQKKTTENTTYHLYSITKTFTALAILQLVEQGKLDIDQSIKKYLPESPYLPEIIIRQLMSHSAGIPNPNPLNWIHLAEEYHSFDRNRFFENIFKKHNNTKSRPNEKFAYSNLGYVMLGQLVETVSSKTYENYVRDHIIKPLGLGPQDLDFEIFDKSNHAKGYQKRTSIMNLALGLFMDKSKFMAKAEGKWKPFRDFYVNGTSYGGLVGTPNALVKYLQELLRPNSILLSDGLKKMLFAENHTNNEKATGMCLSWFKGLLNGKNYFTHAGGGGGYYCEIRIYPDKGIGSVLMFNRSGMRDERFLDNLDIFLIDQ